MLSSMEPRGLDRCEHQVVPVGNVLVAACPRCRQVEWQDSEGPIDPSEGMASLFGGYEILGAFDAIGSPAPEVLVYHTTSARRRRNLAAFPEKIWVKAAPDLWLTHDGERLLLATNHRLLFENLTRGA